MYLVNKASRRPSAELPLQTQFISSRTAQGISAQLDTRCVMMTWCSTGVYWAAREYYQDWFVLDVVLPVPLARSTLSQCLGGPEERLEKDLVANPGKQGNQGLLTSFQRERGGRSPRAGEGKGEPGYLSAAQGEETTIGTVCWCIRDFLLSPINRLKTQSTRKTCCR